MKKLSLIILLALLLALAACGGQEPTPTPIPPTVEPTAAPTEAPPTAVPTEIPPTVEPTTASPLDAIGHQPDPELIDVTWQWTAVTTAVEQTQINDPTRYTIVFNADGTANIKADCNTVLLNYASNNGQIATLQGISSLVACPEDSLDQQFLTLLNNAALYFFQDGDLFIDTFADAGTLQFVAQEIVDLPEPAAAVAAATVTAPDGIFLRSGPGTEFAYVGTAPTGDSGQIIGRNADGDWWAIAAESLPEGKVWVAAAFVEAVNAGSVPVIYPEPELTGVVWQWVSLTTPLDETAVTDPARYTITFNADGTAAIEADCNAVVASYTLDGSSLTITPGPTTLAACPEDSLGDQFVSNLSNAAIYFFLDGDLYLDMFASAGTLRFTAQELVDLPDPADDSAPRGTVTAPDGIFLRSGPGTEYPYVGTAPVGDSGTIIGRSANGQWWVVDAPSFPNGQVWVSALFVEAVNADDVPVIPAPPLEPTLQGITWQWVSLTTPVDETIVNDPGRYTIRFNADGTAGIKADCNTVRATYTTDQSSIAITLGPTTLVACPEDSLEQPFLSGLGNAAVYFFQDGDLYLDMFASSGTLRFIAQRSGGSGTAVATPDTQEPVSTVSGIEFQVVSFGPLSAVQPVLDGTTLTAVFGDSEVSGSAGCNTYTGPLNPVNDFFTVGPIASTLMLCDEPIMQQEQAYLAALQALTGYQWGSERVDNTRVVTAGQLFYTLNGVSGVINLLVP
ncbi:MAG: META domain-containing protein [Chloroflexi bacterium]|nr:META domain-containing protein [Chloroflexota bacterium]